MKKLLMIAGVALMAGFANAAAVQWNSGVFTAGFTGPDGKTLANSTAYTMTVNFYSDSAGKNLVASSTVTKAKANGAYNAKTDDLFTAGGTYYVTALLTENDGDKSTGFTLAEFAVPSNGDGSINFTTGAGFANVEKQYTTGWMAVPEPTSGLLLLLGVAGLALRRKRA